jgi:hypothetical protein
VNILWAVGPVLEGRGFQRWTGGQAVENQWKVLRVVGRQWMM